jgi:hypothetical protein
VLILLLLLFEQNTQLADCLSILYSTRRFLNPNQRRKIDAFKTNPESFDFERMQQ